MEINDSDLIASVLKGDSGSFEPLLLRYQPRVFATARRYARNESEVEDIVQVVFVKAFQKLGGSYASVRDAIFRIEKLPPSVATVLKETFKVYPDNVNGLQFCFDPRARSC